MIAENKKENIWSMNQIFLASFLSGPLGGCYLVSKNYKVLGNEIYAKRSLAVGVIATVILLLVYAFFEIPEGYFRYAIPLGYTMLIWEFAKQFQGMQIKELRESGTQRNSYFKLILISIIFVFLWLTLGFSFGFLLSIFD